ncbi:MAG: Dabb family protein [Cyanobacteriota bacterium]|jgi:hypothetical protein
MVHHFVLFRFRSDLPDGAVASIFAELRALQARIDGITGFSGGADSSKEGLTKGYTHGFCMTFQDAAARDAYLPHPEHQRVVELLLPMLEDGINGVLSFDYQDWGL